MAGKAQEELIIVDGVLRSYSGKQKKIEIPEGVVEIGQRAFAGAYNLTEVVIPKSVKKIGNAAFYLRSGLKSIVLPENVEEIEDGAFWQSGLSDVTIENPDIILGDAVFGRCRNLADENGYVIIKGTLYGYYGEETEIRLPETVTRIGKSAFEESKDISEIIFPEGLTDIGEQAFYYNRELVKIDLPKTVKHIGAQAFGFCKKLESIVGGSDSLVIDREAFDTCPVLNKVAFSDTAVISEDAFKACRIKDSIKTSNMRIKSGSLYGYAGNVESFVVPEYITTLLSISGIQSENLVIPPHVKTVYSYGKVQQKSIEFQNQMEEIGYEFFKESILLESVILPDTLKEIGMFAFQGCSSLKKIAIPESVVTIKECAFDGCDSMEALIIPAAITELGKICGSKPQMPILAPHIPFKTVPNLYKNSMLKGFVRAEKYGIEYSEEEKMNYTAYIKRNKKKLLENQTDEILLSFIQ